MEPLGLMVFTAFDPAKQKKEQPVVSCPPTEDMKKYQVAVPADPFPPTNNGCEKKWIFPKLDVPGGFRLVCIRGVNGGFFSSMNTRGHVCSSLPV